MTDRETSLWKEEAKNKARNDNKENKIQGERSTSSINISSRHSQGGKEEPAINHVPLGLL